MELDIDFSIASRYGERHESYSHDLKVFRSFLRVFEAFFKKEKYQNASVTIDDDAKNKAVIRFCGKKYRLSLAVDPADPKSAMILLAKLQKDRSVRIAVAAIAGPEGIVFPPDRLVSLQDGYEFNNAVLKFFIDGISAPPGPDGTPR